MMNKDKPILLLDFDGVVHKYDSPWVDPSTIADSVTDGFFAWAERAAEHFRLVIYSARCQHPDAIKAMRIWLHEQRKPYFPLDFEFAREKPKAFLTIDDRAICFTGNWDAPELEPTTLLKFNPWNKK